MATIDFSKFDKYTYDICLKPNGVVANGGANGVDNGKSLKEFNLQTPNNFRQFCNQKVIFSLGRVVFGAEDEESVFGDINSFTSIFLDLGIPSIYQYDNFNNIDGDGVGLYNSSTSLVSPMYPRTAKIGFSPTFIKKTGVNAPVVYCFAGRAKQIGGDTTIVEIPNPFSSVMNFQFKYTNAQKNNFQGGANQPIRYDNRMTTIIFKKPVLLNFSIYVEREVKKY